MNHNVDLYEHNGHAIGSIPLKGDRSSYGFITVMPVNHIQGDRDIQLERQVRKIQTRAYTMPPEALADIVNRHPTRLSAAAMELYNRLLVPLDPEQAFHLIYTAKKGEREALTDPAIAVTSGYPLGNHPLMVVYAGGQPIVAVAATSTPHPLVIADHLNLNALNMEFAERLKTTLDTVQPPFFVFEDGGMQVLPVKTSHIFSGGLESQLR